MTFIFNIFILLDWSPLSVSAELHSAFCNHQKKICDSGAICVQAPFLDENDNDDGLIIFRPHNKV